MHVNRHCTEFRSTSCASCTEGTFQDGDNGREQCFLCKHCDAGLGLMVKKSCSSTSDAVCEVLDGFFCSDSNRGGCRTAQRHTVCSPGQYIGQREYRVGGECCPTCPPGMYVSRHCTEYRSTSCASCTEGTFQDGDNGREQCFACQHCDAGLGLKVKKSCSSTSDAVCEVLDGFFCSDSNRGGCRAAQRHTVCSPGQYIGQRGWCQNSSSESIKPRTPFNYNSLFPLLSGVILMASMAASIAIIYWKKKKKKKRQVLH
uniref:TNFR-Cys domain-containing protein n=1 Tax=Gadus morhua TaxID=8049 RepID=A0A8C5B3H8_GADMO